MGLGGGCDCSSCLSCGAETKAASVAGGGLEDTTSGAPSSELESESDLSCCSAGIDGRRGAA
jgi:hypothetical protein